MKQLSAMLARSVFHACFAAVALACAAPLAAQATTSGPTPSQTTFAQDLDAMNARLGPGRPSREVIADAQRLSSTYRSFGPGARGFGAGDQELNRRNTALSLAWLRRANGLYPRDRALGTELMRAYGSIGAFYQGHGSFYPAGAFWAYGGASRMARTMLASGGRGDDVLERDLQQYALAYATAAYAYGPAFNWWQQPREDRPPQQLPAGQAPVAPPPVSLPSVDAQSLSPEQRAQWQEVQDRFRPTAAHVREAGLRINELADRLARQGLTLNLGDAATASKMQGFLEDAVEFIKSNQFAAASESLVRAEYERGRLKNVIGQ